MDQIILYILIGIVAGAALGCAIYKSIKIIKMSPEERKQLLVTYLIGLVTWAEKEIGSGHGAEKLAKVEEWFAKKAPLLYKVVLALIGKSDLRELIELALKEVKENFGK